MRLVLTSERYGIQELDINPMESSSILYQKLQYNTNNPTQYVTDHSLNITLPMTSNNMKLLNYYALLDSTRHMAEIPVLVMDGDNYMCPGVLHINNIGLDHIDSTLQSDLHTYFNKMLNTTFWYDWMRGATPVNDMGMEVLSNMLDKGYNINKDTIFESWITVPTPMPWQHPRYLHPRQESTYDPHTSQSHSIIAWAPTLNNPPKDFIQDQVVIGGYYAGSGTIIPSICNELQPNSSINVDIIGKKNEPHYMVVTDDNKTTAEAKIKDGISSRQWNQFRSYHQKPTVYVSQIWRKYVEISNRYTGYNLILDEDWFTASNPRYSDLVYTLPNINTDAGDTPVDKNINTISSDHPIDPFIIDLHSGCFGVDKVFNNPIRFYGDGSLAKGEGQYAKIHVNMDLNFNFTKDPDQPGDFVMRLFKDSCIVVILRLINDNDPSDYKYYKYMISNSGDLLDSDLSSYPYRKGIAFGNVYFQNGATSTTHSVIIEDDVLMSAKNGLEIYRCELTILTKHDDPDYCLFARVDNELGPTPIYDGPGNPSVNISGQFELNSTNFNRSFRRMEMKDFFPKNYCPFNILMQYCKLFNLVWLIDDTNNTVTVCTREKAFRKGKVYNWDNFVDRSKDIIFSPFSWDSQFITFNYKDPGIDKLKEYKERFGANYGDLKVKTSYNRNTSNKNLLGNSDTDSIFPSTIASSSYYMMYELSSPTPPVEYREVFIDNRGSDTWGQFYFRNNNGVWDITNYKSFLRVDVESIGGPTTSIRFRNMKVCITDDTPFQMDRDLYMVDMTVYGTNNQYMRMAASTIHTSEGDYTTYDTLPIFSIYDRTGKYNCWMGKPAVVYYNQSLISPSIFSDSKDIYTTRWKRIIEEQYDKNNKLVTLYVHLTPIEYINLTCFDFVMFEHMLYSVFKVEGYNEKEQLAKVQLLQVTDYDAYTRLDEN